MIEERPSDHALIVDHLKIDDVRPNSFGGNESEKKSADPLFDESDRHITKQYKKH